MAAFGGNSAFGNSLFGASSTNQPAAGGTGGGIFGSFGQNPTNQQTQQPTTSIFGSTSATNPNNQQQQQQPTTSLFGSTTANTQQQPTTSLFGNTNTNTAGSSTTGASNIFGNSTGGGLFGKPATPTPTTGGNIFGNNTITPNTTTPSTGLFGNTTTQPAAGTGSSSFFAQPPAGQQQQNPNAPKPGLFGNSTTSINPLFGTQNNNTATTSGNTGTGSLFGNSTTTTNPLFGGSNTAGSTPSNPLFGSSTTSAPTANNTLFGTSTTGTGTLFGNSTTQPANNSATGSTLFGNSTLGASALGAKPATGPSGANGLGASSLTQTQGADAQVQFARLQEKMEAIVGAWNASNPATCRFQHYFYNLVDPTQVKLYGRPPNAVNEALWQKAVRENPDPSCLVPVLAMGFDNLRDRVDAQSQQSTAQKAKLGELKDRLQSLTTHHTTTTVPKLQQYSALQTQLMHRLLKLVTHLHLFIPSVRSSAFGENEEMLRSALEEAAAEVGLNGSNGEGRRVRGGKINSKLGELWAVISQLKAREESLAASMGTAGEWKVVDEEGLARITQILAEQQVGLAHLMKILRKDLKDLGIIMGTAGSGAIAEDGDSERVFGASTLRESALRASAFR
ncbi:hypothetical protein D9758_001369 [Tetrapyrgos nigripes]|uniref:Nucleoporin Nup54 alpha-helical domain-containing protein n=1 Tax=Tetrapyrgos nigripes TaxID=182062 RepID=A0A8H5LUG9_9AGAR|nr:hypothetical protein D9758_001369 [Tetrapyrgos nigripes]